MIFLWNIIHTKTLINPYFVIIDRTDMKRRMMMKQSRMIIFTKYFLDFMFYSGILVLVTLPYTLILAGKYYSQEIAKQYPLMLVVFILAGVCGIVIVGQLRKMMRTVISRDCFTERNIKSLKVMGYMAFIISADFLLKVFFLPTPATFVIVLTFFVAGMFSHVLSFVFAEAVRYKEENDLTI